MDWITVTIAVAGLITTAGAPILLARVNARQAERARLRDLRLELYTEASLFAQYAESIAGHYTDPEDRSGPRLAKPGPADGISARMRLLAPENVVTSWKKLLGAYEALDYILDNDGELRSGKLLDWDSAEVKNLNTAIDNFYASASPIQSGPSRQKRISG